MRYHRTKIATGSRLLASVAMLGVLAGCAGERQLTAPFTVTPPSTEPAYIEVQSASFRCPDDGLSESEGTGAKFLPPAALSAFAADFVVKMGSELLKKMQEDRSAVYAATGEVAEGCLPAHGKTRSGSFTVERGARDSSGGDYATPAFKLEGDMTLEASDVPGANQYLYITFKATKLTYGRAAPKAGSGRKRVVLLVQFADQSVVGAGEPDADISLTSPLRIDLGNLQEGYVYNKDMLRHISTSVTIPYPKNPTPVITAVVLETERESVALRALSGAYEDNSGDLADLLKKLLGGNGGDDQ